MAPKGLEFKGHVLHIVSVVPLSAEIQERMVTAGYNSFYAAGADYYIRMSAFQLRSPTAIISDGTDPAYTVFYRQLHRIYRVAGYFCRKWQFA